MSEILQLRFISFKMRLGFHSEQARPKNGKSLEFANYFIGIETVLILPTGLT